MHYLRSATGNHSRRVRQATQLKKTRGDNYFFAHRRHIEQSLALGSASTGRIDCAKDSGHVLLSPPCKRIKILPCCHTGYSPIATMVTDQREACAISGAVERSGNTRTRIGAGRSIDSYGVSGGVVEIRASKGRLWTRPGLACNRVGSDEGRLQTYLYIVSGCFVYIMERDEGLSTSPRTR